MPELTALPLLFPDAVQSDYVPSLSSAADGPATPAISDRSRPVHQRERHARRDREHDEGVGRARLEGGFYYQNSFKPQSIFASFNSQIDYIDNSSNPFDTGFSYANAATGVFNSYTQASSTRSRMAVSQLRVVRQDNWKPYRS